MMQGLERLRAIFLGAGLILMIGITAVHAITAVSTASATPFVAAVSDDFNSCSLAPGWAFTDPVGDVDLILNGTQLLIDMPAKSRHDLWTTSNTAPRLMQKVDDTDFEIEVKFDTSVNAKFQIQGLLIQQDDDAKLRFDFFHDGDNSNIFYAKFVAGNVVDSGGKIIPDGAPMLMRVRREGDVFTQDYAIGSDLWQTHIAIPYSGLAVDEVGIFAGNSGPPRSIPAFTTVVDYFFNTAAPIVPEDNDINTVVTHKVGAGSIKISPLKSSYACGEAVTLTATPANGYVFAGWNGSYNGSKSPFTWIVDGDFNATATFVEATDFLYMPMIFGFDGTLPSVTKQK